MKRVVVLLIAVGWYLGMGIGHSPVFFAEAQGTAPTNVQVCHRPPDNPNNYNTITISASALPAHLAHGELLGACATQCDALYVQRHSAPCGYRTIVHGPQPTLCLGSCQLF